MEVRPAPSKPTVAGPQNEGRPWHALPPEATLEALGSTREGLTDAEASRRLEQYGRNELPQAEPEPGWRRFLRQFHDVLIYILIVAAVVTALLGEWIDTGVIAAVVVINALIGFVQEGKAEAALASIRKMLSLQAVARREGEDRTIEATELVPGDVVFVESGDRVPADIRLIEVRNLQVEEAILTGESAPVGKNVDPVDEKAGIGDRKSMLYSGTTITRGQARGLVVATGVGTEIGRIGEMIGTVETLTTPLLRAINRFGKGLSIAILVVGAVTFAFGYFVQGFAPEELFLITVGLAVAAIPEGLPAIMTITLALGVQRMAERRAILRRLPAVETLGAVTVICSDKTGTLTRNEMTVVRVASRAGVFDASGIGYAPEGALALDGEPVDLREAEPLDELIRTAVLSSDARLRERDDGWFVEGDPTEGALVVLGAKVGRSRQELAADYRRLDTIPFESENRYMATLTEGPDGRWIRLKGAPERVVMMCDRQRGPAGDEEPIDAGFWEETVYRLADDGHRVLAIAAAPAGDGKQDLRPGDVQEGLILLGVVGIIDPPREEAIRAVAECHRAGIGVKMITGDHALTARAIAVQLGIGDGQDAVTGSDLEEIADEDLPAYAREHDIFARVSPEHKLRLVTALQTLGDVVAMTGDGVNDAPALKRADVGVAMGIKGAEASKDASDMVLADDNFATIARAVREGRTIYANLKKTILFILPTNGGEALMMIATVLFAFSQMPITPVQILWVNMVTAVTLALALAFEPTEPGTMQRPPRDPREPILSGYLFWRITFVSVLIAVASLGLFFREMGMHGDVNLSRTVAVNVLVVGQFAYLFNSRFIRRSSLSVRGIFGNRYALLAGGVLLALQVCFTYVPVFHLWFGTAAVPFDRWVWINGAGLAIFLLVELEKAAARMIHPEPVVEEDAEEK